MIRKAIKIFFHLMFFLPGALHGYDQDNFIAINNIPSVLTVVSLDSNGQPRLRGCGFFIDNAGSFVTTAHIVEKADSVLVSWNGQTDQAAFVRKFSPNVDLIIVATKYRNTPPVQLGDSDLLTAGEEVIALCKTQDQDELDFSTGVVKKKSTSEGIDYIEISESIRTGLSGCPLFDRYGKVIGVTTLIDMGMKDGSLVLPINLISKLGNTRLRFADVLIDKHRIKEIKEDEKKSILNSIIHFWMNHSDGFSEVFTKSSP